jgi:hypothetical protein
MASIACPKCGRSLEKSFAGWQIAISVCLFPLGLLSLLAGQQPVTCGNCGTTV